MLAWNEFKETFLSNKTVKESVKDEARKFIRNIFDINKIYENPDEAKDKDILITKENIILKLLSYIEFWKEKGASKNSIIFTLKALRHIVVIG
jgi:hypothetical protein